MIANYYLFSGLLLTSQLHNASQLSAKIFFKLVGDNMDYIYQQRWLPPFHERSSYLEEESDAESGEENNDGPEGEGESEGDAGSGDSGEGKSGGVGKSKIRAGRKGSVAEKKRIHKAAAARGRTNHKCKVM